MTYVAYLNARNILIKRCVIVYVHVVFLMCSFVKTRRHVLIVLG